MIIVVGGKKGGSGKSTVATNLAVMCATEKQDVLLIDSDDQETASDFTILRNETQPGQSAYTCIKLTGSAVRTETLRLANKYEIILLIQGGVIRQVNGRLYRLLDILLVPFVPSSFDVWTLEKVGNLVAEIKTINPDLTALHFYQSCRPQRSR